MNKENVYLLVDNSNTRTKFALSIGGELGEVRILPTRDISCDSVLHVLRGWNFNSVCLCSVVPLAKAVIAEALSGYSIVYLSAALVKSVDFKSYSGVATLGADRVANVVAAVECAPLPLVAVDAGTATTFDVVVQGEDGPCFMGGVIAPGFSSVASCLHAKTAQLPELIAGEDGPVIGGNTREAMATALRVGYPGMISSILDAVEKEIGEKIHVVLTGGDADMLNVALERTCVTVPRLTLQGIAMVATGEY